MTQSRNKRLRNRPLLSSNRNYRATMADRTRDSESRADNLRGSARDAAGSQGTVMRRLHFALFAVLISLGSAPAHGVTLGSVSGSVRDSGGVPQIGAVVQLLRPDLSVAASVFTDSKGRFSIPSVMPGKYALKAMGTSFLPSLRENVRVRSNTV